MYLEDEGELTMEDKVTLFAGDLVELLKNVNPNLPLWIEDYAVTGISLCPDSSALIIRHSEDNYDNLPLEGKLK